MNRDKLKDAEGFLADIESVLVKHKACIRFNKDTQTLYALVNDCRTTVGHLMLEHGEHSERCVLGDITLNTTAKEKPSDT